VLLPIVVHHPGSLSRDNTGHFRAAISLNTFNDLASPNMTSLDPKVAALVDAAKEDDSDEDALIAELENDSHLDAFREQRLQQLHAEFNKAQSLRANNHGSYVEIKDEKALMDITTSTKLCVVHFFKSDFNRCRIMDTHLEVSRIY
jgi:hypothetical protein